MSDRPAGSNIVGTVALACFALGLTAVSYLAHRRGTQGPGGTYSGNNLPGMSGNNNMNNKYGARRGTMVAGEQNYNDGGDAPGQRGEEEKSSYYLSASAERHIRRQNTNLIEWYDDELGLVIPFASNHFVLRSEERQAPLIMLNLDCLRRKEHRVSITIEETFLCETAENYRESSLYKIADCCKILSMSSTRIGSTQHPQAEYCYLDERDRMTYVLAVFLTYNRLALTVQYVAGTRIQGTQPSAFNEVIRSIRFSPPRPSDSYLLVSEPRLGLGYRVPLDFASTDSIPLDDVGRTASDRADDALYYSRSNAVSSSTSSLSVPFITLVGRGARHMGVISSYEPSVSSVVGGGPGVSRYGWQQYLEMLVLTTVRRLGVQPCVPLQLLFKEDMQGRQETAGTILIRPYQVNVSCKGNFSSDEGDEKGCVKLTGSFCLIYENLDPNSPCLPFLKPTDGESGRRAYVSIFVFPVRDECVSFCFIASATRHSVEEFFSFCTTTIESISLGNHHGQSTSMLYCNLRHPVAPFIMSLGAQDAVTVEEPLLGDPLAVFHYHGLERITVTLRVFPLTGRGEQQSGTTTPAGRPTRGSRYYAKMLDHLLRHHLSQLPGGAIVHVWEPFMVHGMIALKLCFEFPTPTGTGAITTERISSTLPPGGVHVDDLEAVSVATSEWTTSRAAALEEEVGLQNPFARYYPPPHPPDSYYGLQPPPKYLPEYYEGENNRANAGKGKGNNSTNANEPHTANSNLNDSTGNMHGGVGKGMNRDYQDGNSIYRNGALHTMNSNALVPSSSILFNKNGSIVQNINTSVARMASPTSDSGAVNSFPNLPPSLDAMDHPLRQDSPNHNSNGNPHKEAALSVSSHSQEEVEDPLRVAVAVVRDRQVFLFTAGTSVYSYAFAQQVVTELAGNVMAVPDSG